MRGSSLGPVFFCRSMSVQVCAFYSFRLSFCRGAAVLGSLQPPSQQASQWQWSVCLRELSHDISAECLRRVQISEDGKVALSLIKYCFSSGVDRLCYFECVSGK